MQKSAQRVVLILAATAVLGIAGTAAAATLVAPPMPEPAVDDGPDYFVKIGATDVTPPKPDGHRGCNGGYHWFS